MAEETFDKYRKNEVGEVMDNFREFFNLLVELDDDESPEILAHKKILDNLFIYNLEGNYSLVFSIFNDKHHLVYITRLGNPSETRFP